MNANDHSALEKLLKQVLKPLVRLFLRHSITYTAILDILKSTYIEVACESAKLSEKRLTDSRVSLLTGVHRKEVKRLREALESHSEPTLSETKASLGAAVMAKWLADPNYCFWDAQGKTASLPKTGPAPSFESLVYSISKDKHFRSLLDDWIAQGMVELNGDHVTLLQNGFVPSEDEAEKLYFAGKNLGAHLEVVTHNLQSNKTASNNQSAEIHTPMFDRAVFYHGLSVDSIQQIEAEAKRRNLETLTAINQMASQAKQACAQTADETSQKTTEKTSNKTSDTSSKSPLVNPATQGFHLGCYFYRNLSHPEFDQQQASSPKNANNLEESKQ